MKGFHFSHILSESCALYCKFLFNPLHGYRALMLYFGLITLLFGALQISPHKCNLHLINQIRVIVTHFILYKYKIARMMSI